MNVFEVIDKIGKRIRLTQKQWSHIRVEHEDLIEQEDIKRALINPVKIMATSHINFLSKSNNNLHSKS